MEDQLAPRSHLQDVISRTPDWMKGRRPVPPQQDFKPELGHLTPRCGTGQGTGQWGQGASPWL